MNFKKRIYYFITLQKRNFFGRFLEFISNSIKNSLENKMNDNELSGEYRVIRKIAKLKPEVVFDVGANMGSWTTEFKKHSPESKVFLFEPVPETFHVLNQNMKLLHDVYPNELALSNICGSFDFKYYPANSYFSSIYSTNLDSQFLKITVNSITGDEFCDRNRISRIDYLKIDVEGLEDKVILGFSKRLQNQDIDMIQFEYGPINVESKFLLKDFFEFFEKYGYKVGKIYPTWIDWSLYRVEKENFILSNFIAVSTKSKIADKLLKDA